MKLIEMDERITFSKHLEEDVGLVIVISKFNIRPEDVDKFLESWASGAKTMKQPAWNHPHSFIVGFLVVLYSSTTRFLNLQNTLSVPLTILAFSLDYSIIQSIQLYFLNCSRRSLFLVSVWTSIFL